MCSNTYAIFRLADSGDPLDRFDTAVMAACVQGIVNRSAPRLYLDEASPSSRPAYWKALLQREGEWLYGARWEELESLEALLEWAGARLHGQVIWDPHVPATLNVATTVAGVEDAIVTSPEKAESCPLPVMLDLRHRFDGRASGSAKNDAYRWCLDAYLRTGRCSLRKLFLEDDAWTLREQGLVTHAVNRDGIVASRGFVFDLSPWSDEAPADEPRQPVGVDASTYRAILETVERGAGGRWLTELIGFFAFRKYSSEGRPGSRHAPVPTEWETVYQATPYGVYQSTLTTNVFNQSFHAHARVNLQPVKPRPPRPPPLAPVTYLCFHMGDYDSPYALYERMPRYWEDPYRGELPLAWGVSPHLMDTFPDLIERLYRTATPNDFFVADAGAAGYFNPSRVPAEKWPLFIRHNRQAFSRAGYRMAPMVLDWSEPSAQTLDAFRQFAPDGFGTIIHDFHRGVMGSIDPRIWKGMPVIEMTNAGCEIKDPHEAATLLLEQAPEAQAGEPRFIYWRRAWTYPSTVGDTLHRLRSLSAGTSFVPLDPATFFHLLKQHLRTPRSNGAPRASTA